MSHQCLSMTRGFEGNHVIPVRTHQHLKMKKKIVYSQLKSREKSHAMGRKKRTKTRQSKKSYEILFVCFNYFSVCLSCLVAYYDEPIDGKFTNGERELRERKKKGPIGSTETGSIRYGEKTFPGSRRVLLLVLTEFTRLVEPKCLYGETFTTLGGPPF